MRLDMQSKGRQNQISTSVSHTSTLNGCPHYLETTGDLNNPRSTSFELSPKEKKMLKSRNTLESQDLVYLGWLALLGARFTAPLPGTEWQCPHCH